MNNMNSTLGRLLAGGVSLILIVALVWFLGAHTGLDLPSQLWFYSGFVVGAAILTFGVYQDIVQPNPPMPIAITYLLAPLALAAVWGGLWPAMHYWAFDQSVPLWIYTQSDSDPAHLPMAWWGTNYTRFGGLFVILVGGYYWLYRRIAY